MQIDFKRKIHSHFWQNINKKVKWLQKILKTIVVKCFSVLQIAVYYNNRLISKINDEINLDGKRFSKIWSYLVIHFSKLQMCILDIFKILNYEAYIRQ